jgi:hypothetical protein
MLYRGIIKAVNGAVPGPASDVSYDVQAAIGGSVLTLEKILPADRDPDVESGLVHVAGYAVGRTVTLGEIGGGSTPEIAIITAEPMAKEEAS